MNECENTLFVSDETYRLNLLQKDFLRRPKGVVFLMAKRHVFPVGLKLCKLSMFNKHGILLIRTKQKITFWKSKDLFTLI